MNTAEARKILVSYRPGRPEASDPEVAEALALAQKDPQLRRWLEQQTDFHRSVRQALHRIPVPDNLRERILAQAKVVTPNVVTPPAWTWRRGRWAMAAAIALLLGFAAFWLLTPSGDGFSTFRSRMVRAVLRQYSMDIQTNDLGQIRQYLGARQAPADFVLRPGLARLPVTGAGVLSWQGQRVSMVCLDGGARQGTLFLFVVDRAAVRRAPGESPELLPVSKLMTASWTDGDRTYLLAGQGARGTLQTLGLPEL